MTRCPDITARSLGAPDSLTASLCVRRGCLPGLNQLSSLVLWHHVRPMRVPVMRNRKLGGRKKRSRYLFPWKPLSLGCGLALARPEVKAAVALGSPRLQLQVSLNFYKGVFSFPDQTQGQLSAIASSKVLTNPGFSRPCGLLCGQSFTKVSSVILFERAICFLLGKLINKKETHTYVLHICSISLSLSTYLYHML